MKLDSITAYHYRIPLKTPFRISAGKLTEKEGVLFEMRSGDLVGWGEAMADAVPFFSGETVGSTLDVARRVLIPLLLAEPVPEPAAAVERMDRFRGNLLLKAGLEAAIFDLYGQSLGRRCADLIGGGVRELIEIGPSIGIKDTPADTVAAVAQQLELGRRRIKLKVTPGFDLEYLRAVRREFPDCTLMVDANSAYTPDDFEHLKRFDEFKLLMIEQPLDENDLYFHAQLRRKLDTPICLDESIRTCHDMACAVAFGACDIVNIKVCRVGGLVKARQIHDLCRRHGIANWVGSMIGTGVGTATRMAAASLPNCTLPCDCAPPTHIYLAEDILAEPWSFADGCHLALPSGPGLGVRVDRRKLKCHTVAQETYS